ncbi:hypothetical protein K437DRAFT_252864 [Tilletiaria anomala UBC 951]|uniref:FYVE-type domain-containing protein n=1 Tax=Tilletiaria anomala (strain ATCC 24038 / CBS 436.72 / UBC 951) TaxID=1037660 RepID=A0A066WHM5_TILAU|nr:uncharacterized protein K437DRAFT_252864 [Tilletiaria anomala UBC 951]KDN53502.1 hypothetical protein K437DRAFT_252864 [Tilletiaria anomala UBC 951]
MAANGGTGLSYTPYTRKTHSRGPSTASFTSSVQDVAPASSAAPVAPSHAGATSSSLLDESPSQPQQQQQNGRSAPSLGAGQITSQPLTGGALRVAVPLGTRGAQVNGALALGRGPSSVASGSAPPPLRRISEIRKAAATTAQPRTPAKAKAKSSKNDMLPHVTPASSSSSASASESQLSPNLKAAVQAVYASANASVSFSRSGSPPPSASAMRHDPMRHHRATSSIGSSGTNTPYPLSLPPTNMNAHSASSSLYTSLVNDPIPIPSGPALGQVSTSASADPPGQTTSRTDASTRQTGLTGAYSEANGRLTSYRPGFQARGVYRVLTEEFEAARRQSRSAQERRRAELAEERLTRRLEKLLAIHLQASDAVRAEALAKTRARRDARAAGAAGVAGDNGEKEIASSVRGVAGNVWSTLRFRASQLASSLEDPEKVYLRTKEQEIVHWEDDKAAKRCPICNTPFSLAVRKHHCRLCGRVVCASPQLTRFAPMERASAVAGQKQAQQNGSGPGDGHGEDKAFKCSGLVLADPKSMRVSSFFVSSQPGGGSDPGSASPSLDVVSEKAPQQMSTDFLRIRICRECRDTVCKRQYMLDDGNRVPMYLKLYEALMRLQREIEESLPEFQEMVLGLQKQDANATLGVEEGVLTVAQGNSSGGSDAAQIKQQQVNVRMMLALQKDAAAARKQLLANFANYDALARRIRSLPPEDSGPFGGASGRPAASTDQAQERLQQAVWTRANLFLQQNMFPLQALPKFVASKKEGIGSPTSSATSTPPLGGAAKLSEGAVAINGGGGGSNDASHTVGALRQQLSVLLEQEELVASYVDSANKARKFDDARSLRMSLDELRKEIVQIRRQLGIPPAGASGGAKTGKKARR